ncbi:MAG: Holliday junction resolvase RecU [Mycoplasma sp.]
MQNKSHSNRGMFLETLINQTSWYYENNQIALISKRHIPTTIYERDGNMAKVKLESKSCSDYYGSYKRYMIDFEAKQTMNEFFITANIKKHQRAHLKICYDFGIITFLLIHFIAFDKYFACPYSKLSEVIIKSKIPFEWFKNNAFELEIIFPGILNISDFLETQIIYNN